MADFDIIEDVTKAIPKGKDLKKLTPFIVGGLALGVITLVMNRRSGTASGSMVTDTSGVGQSTDLGGLMADFTNQTNEAIKKNNEVLTDGVNSQLTTVISNLYDVISGQNDRITGQNDLIKDQVGLFSQLRSDFTSQLNDVRSIYNNSFNVQNDSSGSLPVIQSIYFDGIDDSQQYKNVVDQIASSIKTGSLTTTQASQLKKEVAGLGNNGIGDDPSFSQAKANLERMKTDITFRNAELERTQLVIQNRTEAGLSTTAQQNWLNQINNALK